MPRRTLRLLALGTILMGSSACKSLPDEVPFQGRIMLKSGSGKALQPLLGGDLLLDGKKVATIDKSNNAKFMVVADWTAPKSRVKGVMGGEYTIQITGACGPATLKAEGPNEVWRSKGESALAEDVEKDGAVPVFIRPTMPEPRDLLVNWGSGDHTIQVGEVKLPKGEKRISIVLEGCNSPPAVTVDGKEVGKLDLSSPVHVISADPTQCHGLFEVAFGEHKRDLAAPIFLDTQVAPIKAVPSYVFERAPDSIKVRGGGGMSLNELVPRPCPR